MKTWILCLVLFYQLDLRAQNCDQFPADCPDNETLQQQAGKKWAGPADLKVKEEYAMQDSLRHFTTAMMHDAAKKKNWECYAFLEDDDPGIGIGGNTKPLPYKLRRPCQWAISYVFIVNRDSLEAWRNWYNNDLQNRANDVVNSYKESNNNLPGDDLQKKYPDSAAYYGDVKTKYMTGHAGDYQKALLSGDQKGIKKYEDEMKKYDDKINSLITKANENTTHGFSASEKKNQGLQDYKLTRTIAFRNASIVRITIQFNHDIAGPNDFASSDPEKAARINKATRPGNIPAALFSVFQHNNEPDNEWGHGPDVAFLYFGKWDLKTDEYYFHHAGFSKDKKNTDPVSVKEIPCDKVQTITISAEGSPKYINQFLQSLDSQKLNSIIFKE